MSVLRNGGSLHVFAFLFPLFVVFTFLCLNVLYAPYGGVHNTVAHSTIHNAVSADCSLPGRGGLHGATGPTVMAVCILCALIVLVYACTILPSHNTVCVLCNTRTVLYSFVTFVIRSFSVVNNATNERYEYLAHPGWYYRLAQ